MDANYFQQIERFSIDFVDKNPGLREFVAQHPVVRFRHLDSKVAIFEAQGINGVMKYMIEGGEVLDDFVSHLVLRGLRHQIALQDIPNVQRVYTREPKFFSGVRGLIGPFEYYHSRNLKGTQKFVGNSDKALEFFFDLESVLKRIHDRRIIHADIKPGNILENGVLIDFSSCATFEEAADDWSADIAFTPGYLPSIEKSRDFYALGITFAETLLGEETCNRGNISLEIVSDLLEERFDELCKEYFLDLVNRPTEQNLKRVTERLLERRINPPPQRIAKVRDAESTPAGGSTWIRGATHFL